MTPEDANKSFLKELSAYRTLVLEGTVTNNLALITALTPKWVAQGIVGSEFTSFEDFQIKNQ